jgi:hypothetical protein
MATYPSRMTAFASRKGLTMIVSRLHLATLVGLSVAVLGCGGDDDAKAPTTGPGAALKCTSSGKNAWETYGVTAFVAVNEKIFELVGAELTANGSKNVGDSFAGVDDFPTFKGRLAAFLVFVYGGPTSIQYTDGKTYDGVQDMKAAHAGMGITSAQYDYFVANVVVPALTGNGVPAGDVSSCFAPPVVDAAFKASIVGQ